MLVVNRLAWIVLGLGLGIGIGMAPHVVAQDRVTHPPITIKFIGILEKDGAKWAIFSDANSQPVYAKEGQLLLGQYKLLQVDVDSVTMSYIDGTGVQTIPMSRSQRVSVAGPGGAAHEQDQVLTDHPAAGGGRASWFFVSDSRTHSCWLSSRDRAGNVTALAPAPPEACR